MNRRQLLKSTAAALLLPAPNIVRAQDAKVLKFVPYADVAILDPIFTGGYFVRTHALAVWDTLYGLDENFQPQPQMVEGHTVSADGRTWTLTLRPGMVFHDGSRVLARDAVASVKRWGARDTFGQALMAATEELSATDDRTLVFRLKRPFPQLPAALARTSTLIPAIMPERIAQTDPFKQIQEIVGSGPYRYLAAERVTGALHAYARHEGYVPRGGTPSFTAGPRIAHFDRVEFQVMPDPATAVAALQTGQVDWVEEPLMDLLPILRSNKDIVVEVKDPSGMAAVLRLNHLHPPFDNPAIRRVVLRAVNQTECMQAVAGEDRNLWSDQLGFFSVGSPLQNDAGMQALTGPKDYDQLRKDPVAAGYKGEKVVFVAGQNVPRVSAVCEVVASAMRKIGMEVDYVASDWGAVLQRMANPRPVTEGGWNCVVVYYSGMDLAIPATSPPLMANGRKARPGWPDSPGIEALRAEILDAGTDAERLDIARKLQEQAMADVPYVPAGQYFQPVAYRKSLTGVMRGLPVFTNLRRT